MFRLILTSLSFLSPVLLTEHSVISRGQAYSVLAAAKAGNSSGDKRTDGLDGKIFTGYQGWFRAPGDGSGLGFSHYEKNGKFEPGSCSIDLWPDLKDFTPAEKFATPFRHADGGVAHVFSSLHPRTVNRHFQWMRNTRSTELSFNAMPYKAQRSRRTIAGSSSRTKNSCSAGTLPFGTIATGP